MSNQDAAYYLARAAAERVLSQNATNPAAAQVHANLAERYDRLARRSEDGRPVLHIVPAPMRA
jgi:hypothetical protein